MPTSKPQLKIKISNTDDGGVLVTCDDLRAAKDDQYIHGSSWEDAGGMAYAILTDDPGLHDELVIAGYDVDASEYCYTEYEEE